MIAAHRPFSPVRRRHLTLAIAALALGAGCFFYQGPGRPFTRGYLGDVAAEALVFAIVSLCWRGPLAARATLAGAIAVALELRQLVVAPQGQGVAREILLGASFDWLDLLAYAVGLALAIAWERWPRSLTPAERA